MLPHKHIFFGAIFTFLIFLLLHETNIYLLLLIFLSTFLIDFDHYLYFVLKKKNINPAAAVSWYMSSRKKFLSLSPEQEKKVYTGLYIFHCWEFLLIIFLAGFFIYRPILLIFSGLLFHLALDWYEEFSYGRKPIKQFLILDVINSKRLISIDKIE